MNCCKKKVTLTIIFPYCDFQKPMKRIQVTKELPMIGIDDIDIHRDDEGEIHVFAHPTDDVVIHQDDRITGEVRSAISN